ncbi:GH1 family beta-glucosidase [uncultured Thiodictyon sp.]|uniref:GH1 family beta-glucosidase n=1 Tax=uncultured Thiodictyon sp. TaxID=1846217 RepID=UPI0025E55EE0|nr:GH1 family beta-glucosidase [uncultured Thiodictyon sp.]
MSADQPFPPGFLWGTATSAYQIEGSPLADGAGPGIWHGFSHRPGAVVNGDTGDRACDHYRRLPADLDLMAELGLTAYRFSVAWGRVLPNGTGRVNAKGLDFYQRLVDGLLERGIQPMLTLYHWDLPEALEARGGWLNPDSARWFADYAAMLYEALDDRVGLWVTLNEPWVSTVLGYLSGEHAPGRRSLAEPPRVAHHQLCAHGEAVAAYRELGRHQIGISLNLEPQHPATDSPLDWEAAKRRHHFINRWFLDPLLRGQYPDELAVIFGSNWPRFPVEDLRRIAAPLDFLGINYYSRGLIRHDPTQIPCAATRITPPERRLTAMDWEVYPEGLTETLLWVKQRYGDLPLYITENGAAFDDAAPVGNQVQDPDRVDYLRTHLAAARAALEQGVDLRGYFAWSLLDNFEWAEGYAKRFGLVHVDHATQRRTLKASAQYYRDFILEGELTGEKRK